MLPSRIWVNGTAGTLMTARVKVTSIGTDTPARWKVTCTWVPGTPVSWLETKSNGRPVTGIVSTRMMRSPTITPPASPGVLGKMFPTVMRPSWFSMDIPTPP